MPERDVPDPSVILTSKRAHVPSARQVEAEANHAKRAKANSSNAINDTEDASQPIQNDTGSELHAGTLTPPPCVQEIPNIYEHRMRLPKRPSMDCTTDTSQFKKSDSLVYHFLVISDQKFNEDGKLEACKLKCTFCLESKAAGLFGVWNWNTKSGGSTSNFLTHFEKHHTSIWTTLRKTDQAIINPSQAEVDSAVNTLESAFSKAFDWDIFYEKLIKWIVVSCQPFTEVESEELRDLLAYLKPAARKMVKADQLKEKFNVSSETGRQRLKNLLSDIPGKIPIACDAWTSSNRIAFLATTATWIDKEWRLHEVLLDFKELKGVHSGENMAESVYSSLKELDIRSKFISVTSDNASNNGTLMRALMAKIKEDPDKDEVLVDLEFDGEHSMIRCLAHVIHLAIMAMLVEVKAVRKSDVRKDMVDVEDLNWADAEDIPLDPKETEDIINAEDVDLTAAIQKLRKVAKLTRSSPQRNEEFHDYARKIERVKERQRAPDTQASKMKAIKNLILDVITRWNSMVFMLERAGEYQEAIDLLCKDVVLYKRLALSADEWAIVRMSGHTTQGGKCNNWGLNI